MFSLEKHGHQKENKRTKHSSFVEEVEIHEYEGDNDSEDDCWDDGSIRKQSPACNHKKSNSESISTKSR